MPSCAVGAGARTDTRRASENAGTEETGTGIGERETGKGEREERETGTGETHGRHGGVTRGETTTIGVMVADATITMTGGTLAETETMTATGTGPVLVTAAEVEAAATAVEQSLVARRYG